MSTSQRSKSSILNPAFRYYSSVDTDLRRTFKRVRDERLKARIIPVAPNHEPRLPRHEEVA